MDHEGLIIAIFLFFFLGFVGFVCTILAKSQFGRVIMSILLVLIVIALVYGMFKAFHDN